MAFKSQLFNIKYADKKHKKISPKKVNLATQKDELYSKSVLFKGGDV